MNARFARRSLMHGDHGNKAALIEVGQVFGAVAVTVFLLSRADFLPIVRDNLLEEVRDAHPLMLRKFAMAASAAPRPVR